ncbi:SDR family NAD(P)-dependent oxidoreductase [Streptomyces xanthophaeus]|uniref:SDR family NAD(P)-dependent oxidoreductase n=1 Tax=Streptomyces xanthophaeus TaxID=67385 RepID=UPI00398FBFE7
MPAPSRKPLAPHGRAVLITGASSGLGRACALHLDRVGFRVFAGVRDEGVGKELEEASPDGLLRAVRVDVTDAGQIREAAARIDRDTGGQGLWGLVNNAGVCVPAPLECVTPERLRWQFDTNVVGQLAVTQAFLPQLRRTRGRLVNVTSGLGTVALPYLGAYASAQFAKEALSDVLRRELREFGVAVSVVQPGAVLTPIWDKVTGLGREALDGMPGELAELYRIRFNRFLYESEQAARASRTTPAATADSVRRALTDARPRTRYRVGTDVKRLVALARLLPDTALDRYLRPAAG